MKSKRNLPELYRGIWIPRVIMDDPNLRIFEKVILALVLSLSNNENNICYASNGYLGSCLNYSSRRVQQLLSSLMLKKYIEVRNSVHGDMNKTNQRRVYILSPTIRSSVRTDIILDKNSLIKKDPEFEKVLMVWFDYLSEVGKVLPETSKNATYQKLYGLANGSTELANQIIAQSISSGWQSLYPFNEKPVSKSKLAKGVVLKPSQNDNFKNFKF